MNDKVKKMICVAASVSIMAGVATYMTPIIINSKEKYSDSDSYSSYDDVLLDDALEFNDEFNRSTFYVQKNNDEEFLSLNEEVEGYNCEGIYSSKSSSDKVLYILNIDTKKAIAVDYDYLENYQLKKEEKVYVITKNSPASIKKQTFIPRCSIDKIGYSKTLE